MPNPYIYIYIYIYIYGFGINNLHSLMPHKTQSKQTKPFILQLRANSGRSLKNPPEAKNDKDGRRQRERVHGLRDDDERFIISYKKPYFCVQIFDYYQREIII